MFLFIRKVSLGEGMRPDYEVSLHLNYSTGLTQSLLIVVITGANGRNITTIKYPHNSFRTLAAVIVLYSSRAFNLSVKVGCE